MVLRFTTKVTGLANQSSYFPTNNRTKLLELFEHVNEDDARKILNSLLQEFVRQDSISTLSESATTAIILMNADACCAPVETEIKYGCNHDGGA